MIMRKSSHPSYEYSKKYSQLINPAQPLVDPNERISIELIVWACVSSPLNGHILSDPGDPFYKLTDLKSVPDILSTMPQHYLSAMNEFLSKEGHYLTPNAQLYLGEKTFSVDEMNQAV